MGKNKLTEEDRWWEAYPVVSVEWVDSCMRGSGWIDHEDLENYTRRRPVVCASIGFLVDDREDSLTLIASANESQFAFMVCIPAAAVRKRSVIQAATGEKVKLTVRAPHEGFKKAKEKIEKNLSRALERRKRAS